MVDQAVFFVNSGMDSFGGQGGRILPFRKACSELPKNAVGAQPGVTVAPQQTHQFALAQARQGFAGLLADRIEGGRDADDPACLSPIGVS